MGTSAPQEPPDFACRCLNVVLYFKSTDTPTPSSPDAHFTPRFVNDDGIQVKHPHLTLRIRSGVPRDASQPRQVIQYTTLTCLVCRTVTYRVAHEVMSNDAPKEGPVWPSQDWVEQDLLKSKNGWIDVHIGSNGCIARDDINKALSSTPISPPFSLVLPESASTTELSLTPPPSEEHQPNTVYSLDLPPLFPPPPFIPSHSVFMYLSSTATGFSTELRMAAESRIAEYIRHQTELVETAEQDLRSQVARLWKCFRDGLDAVEEERRPVDAVRRATPTSPQSRSSSRAAVGSPIIREFNPTPVPRMRSPPHTATRSGTSALSTSLASGGFFHPRATDTATTPVNGSTLSSSQTVPSSRVGATGENTLLSPPLSPATSMSPTLGGSGSTIPVAFRRNMNEGIDTAATYMYYSIEGVISRNGQANVTQGIPRTAPETSARAVPSTSKNSKSRDDLIPQPRDVEKQKKSFKAHDSDDGLTSPESKEKKARRKVTFDMEPDVVTIKREVIAEQQEKPVDPGRDEEMIFDLEGNDDDLSMKAQATDDGEEKPAAEEIKLPLKEPAEEPRLIPRSKRNAHGPDGPFSFGSLRPASLPIPSFVRPPIKEETPTPELILKAPPRDRKGKAKEVDDATAPESTSTMTNASWHAHEMEIRKLVAADTPSHRGSWNRDGDSWKMFVRRQKDRGTGTDSPSIPEDVEEGNIDNDDTDTLSSSWRRYHSPNMVGSLPISIGPIGKPALEEYYKQTYSSEAPVATEAAATVASPPVAQLAATNGTVKSSAAARKAVYAQRDRVRSMDPGALDYIVDEEEDGEEEGADVSADVAGSFANADLSTSRRNALEILKIRSEVPPSGMWRSLAD